MGTRENSIKRGQQNTVYKSYMHSAKYKATRNKVNSEMYKEKTPERLLSGQRL